mgnify:CR=1 FL=1
MSEITEEFFQGYCKAYDMARTATGTGWLGVRADRLRLWCMYPQRKLSDDETDV